ncbi:TetR/AcrR family transcriptional regulator [Saccharophagus degradans]|uniref:TetR/AcrR family transcriptional regulator n=1 Tax=Saccharophagus degradans TaxID=86304 RepID=A0AAW7X4V5_9GAMM|nr:TetR/AcrR family transcriptional regulator [Saccharophagus degradans]MDO6422003.1 TetR/AcrR family transcriptional regulator [Saccharophagus degradans]MDO6606304.1 TetR/AcrR family transcriptional regulator [Saccharophagus degradans]
MQSVKDPTATRLRILQVAAGEIINNGYKAASLANILANSGVSKGALYHHFPSKLALGHAVFEELYVDRFQHFWGFPLENEAPIQALCDFLLALPSQITEDEMTQGCPVCSLAMEMSAEDECFRSQVQELFEWLCKRVQAAFVLAQQNGQLKDGVNLEASARFIVASIQGVQMQARYMEDKAKVSETLIAVVDYLKLLMR